MFDNNNEPKVQSKKGTYAAVIFQKSLPWSAQKMNKFEKILEKVKDVFRVCTRFLGRNKVHNHPDR